MMKLYQLIFCDMELSYDDYREEFTVGIFSTLAKARQTAKYYIRNVQGFKDYQCDYEIIPKNVIGTADNCRQVYIIEGWNVNANLDETDIVESDCFTDRKTAEQELAGMQKKYLRSEWTISRWKINECCWTEGFVRIGY